MPAETPSTPSNPPIPRNPQPVEQVPLHRDAPQPTRGILARVRAWFAAAVATVRAAAAPPQAQQGTDLVDTAPAVPGKFRVWLAGAWAAVKRGRVAIILIVIGVLLLMAVERWWPSTPPADQPAAAQPQVPTELVDRVYALDAHVVDLQDRVAALENSQQPQAEAPRRSAAQRAAPAPSTQTAPEPERRRWGTTDLDRAITDFTPSTTFGARP